jgi:CRP/FNR family transcriptional regulator, cyclic AMP receptor protein
MRALHSKDMRNVADPTAMNAAELASYLARHPVLAGLPPEHIALIVSFATVQQHPAQSRIFVHDQDADAFYIVHSGRVTIEVPALGAEPLAIQNVGPDSILGWSWLLPPYRWLFDARASVASTVVAVDGKRLREACEQDPALGYRILKLFAALMAERLNAARVTAMRHYSGV